MSRYVYLSIAVILLCLLAWIVAVARAVPTFRYVQAEQPPVAVPAVLRMLQLRDDNGVVFCVEIDALPHVYYCTLSVPEWT